MRSGLPQASILIVSINWLTNSTLKRAPGLFEPAPRAYAGMVERGEDRASCSKRANRSGGCR